MKILFLLIRLWVLKISVIACQSSNECLSASADSKICEIIEKSLDAITGSQILRLCHVEGSKIIKSPTFTFLKFAELAVASFIRWVSVASAKAFVIVSPSFAIWGCEYITCSHATKIEFDPIEIFSTFKNEWKKWKCGFCSCSKQMKTNFIVKFTNFM